MTASSVRNSSISKLKEHKPAPRVHLVTAGSNSGGNAGPPPICESEPRALIAPGKYEAYCSGFELCHVRRYKRTSLRLDFQLTCEPDIQVSRFVNMGKGKGEKRGPSTDFYRLWSLFNGEVPKRRQQMNLEVFAGKFCMVSVETVVEDSHGNALPELLRYSVVREVLEVWEP
jgi:hypothetical protein